MTRHWTTTARKDGKPITLYCSTCNAAVRRDLGKKLYPGSLIESASLGEIPSDPAELHYFLAGGAFKTYIRSKRLQWNAAVNPIDAIPESLPNEPIRGDPQTHPVLIHVKNADH
jgi:hypothetical protein